jgi:UDP:flavonoid glycosyltransferase YjiC (YdhE family)
VYIATGTMVQLLPSQVHVIAAAAATLAQQHGVRVLWSLKPASWPLLPPELLPPAGTAAAAVAAGSGSAARTLVLLDGRALVVAWAPQPAVLAHPATRLFVSHGGMGSTHEGLSAGVPILCLPFSGDQPTVAAQLVSRGLGLALQPTRLRVAELLATLRRLLDEQCFAAAAAAVGERLLSVSPASQAAQLLLEFAAAGDGSGNEKRT